MNDKKDLPTAREMIPALITGLQELGREATVREIEEKVSRLLKLTQEQLAMGHDKSRTEFQYRLAWTRTYAKKDGLVVSAMRNRWSLAQPS